MSLFKGCATALITPFKDGKIDYVSMGKIIENQIKEGVDALVVCGTTGEASTLSDKEKFQLVKFTVDLVKNRVPVIAGAGSNDTKHAIDLSKEMEQSGANGLLIVTPYYNKCSEKGLITHYEKIADSVEIPIVMYSVPSRTGVNIKPSTVNILLKHPNIVGIKEASGNISQICEKRISKPSEAVTVGEKVKVKVTAIKDGKLSLSIKEANDMMAKEIEEEVIELPDSNEQATTSLGSLFANIKLN